jgi:hypothetical protein
LALRPATAIPVRWIALTGNPQTTVTTFFAKQGNQGSRKMRREYHYTPEKFRMECVWKSLLRRYRVRRLPENSVRSLELAKGIEPPTL